MHVSGSIDRWRSMTGPLAAIVFLFMGMGPTSADEIIDQCSLPTGLVAPMLAIEPRTSDCAPTDACAMELVRTARKLADEHPDLTPVHRSYQDLARTIGGQVFDDVLNRYRIRLEYRPSDPASNYLSARIDPGDPADIRAA